MLKPNIRRVLLLLLSGVAIVVLPFLIMVGLVLSWHMQDESLRPDAEMVLTEPAALPPPDQQNLYFAVLGFWGADPDIWTTGMNYWLKASDNSKVSRISAPAGMEEITLPNCDNQPRCRQEQLHGTDIAILKANANQLQRYRKLRSFPSYAMVYADSMQLETPQPRFDKLPHALWQLDVTRKFLDGQHEASLQDIAGDFYFWELIARQADNLALLATAHQALQSDYQLLAELGATAPATFRKKSEALSAVLGPLPVSVNDFRQVLRGEGYRLGWALRDAPLHWDATKSNLFQHLQGMDQLISTQIGRWFYKPKASINQALHELGKIPQALNNPLPQLMGARDKLVEGCDTPKWGLRSRLDNYSGKLLVCHNLPAWKKPGLIIKRTEAWRRLVNAQFQLILTGNTSAIQAESLKNPYDTMPAKLDLTRKWLVFSWPDGMTDANEIKVALP